VPLVVDPVMVASKGRHRLLRGDAEATLRDTLLPMADLLTPNLPEAEVLVGFPVSVEANMRRAAERLAALGAKAVLMKGGHLEGETVVDLLFHGGRFDRFEDRRIPGRNTHGTGCTLASAIAAGLAQKMSLLDAVTRARTYVRQAIATAPGLGRGLGPLNHAVTVK
jgi:hydroxymethylpyrimidine/phosphomethylpyrimidine kinase